MPRLVSGNRGGGFGIASPAPIDPAATGAVAQLRTSLTGPITWSKLSGSGTISVSPDGVVTLSAALGTGGSATAVVRAANTRGDAVERSIMLTAAAGTAALTLGGPLTFTTTAAAGTLVATIGGVPAGVTPTLTPNDGRLAIGGDQATGWKVVVGTTASMAGTIAITVAATGATSASANVTVTAGATSTNAAWHNVGSGVTNTFAQNAPNDLSAGRSYYGPVAGTNPIGNQNENETIVSFPQSASVVRDARSLMTQQSNPNASRWRFRVNGTAGAIVVVQPGATIPTGSAVVYSDATNIQAIADGESPTWQLQIDPTTTGIPGNVNPSVGAIFEGGTGTRKSLAFYSSVAVSYSTGVDRFVSFSGLASQQPADCGAPAPVAGVLDRAAIRLSVAGGGAKAARLFVAGAVKPAIVVPMLAVGINSDPTNIQPLASGEPACWVLQGSGTAPGVQSGSIRFTSNVTRRIPMWSQSASPIAGNGVAPGNFFNFDHMMRRNNVAGESRAPVPRAGTMRALHVRCTVNTGTLATPVTLRRLSTNLALSAVVPAATTGIFSDPTNMEALTAGDPILWMAPQSWESTVSLIAITAAFETTT